MFSVKDESSFRGILSISMPVGNSPLSFFAALKDFPNAGGVLLTPKKFSIVFTPPNLSLRVFTAKKSPVCFVKRTHLSPL